MKTHAHEKKFRLFGLSVLAATFIAWLLFGENGFIGRLGTIGFAFCHQIPARTPQFPFGACPLCFRCTGLFLGACLSAITWIRAQLTARGLKRPFFLAAGPISFALYVFDGVKTTGLIRWMTALYPDTALFRYLTGYAMGVTVGAIVAVMWREVVIANHGVTAEINFLRHSYVYAQFNIFWRFTNPLFGILGAFLLITRAPVAIPFQWILTLFVGIAPFLLSGTLLTVLISAIELLVPNEKPRLHLWTRLILGFALAAIFIAAVAALRYQLSGGWVRMFQVNNTVN